MTKAQRLAAIEELLRKRGWDQDSARQAARAAVKNGEPLLESLCFQALAENILATIHSSSWIRNRAKDPSCDGHDVIKRLIDSGASPRDLAIFARMMQREYLSNLGCILDGAGIYGTPRLPCEDFRIFAVDDSEKPLTKLDELHESLGWVDLETEMRLSREAAQQGG
ncbi:MAG TPA: hypothetical protein VNK04_11660 [Gemmataceae bacterium]|nr:hypothetical protein [Gemmataceae bacterium]